MFRSIPAVAAAVVAGLALIVSGCSTSDPAAVRSPATPSSTPRTSPRTTTLVPPRSSSRPAPSSSASSDRGTVSPLPVDEPTHDAKQVITVTAPSRRSTTAVLQRWTRTPGGWRRVGSGVPANLGTDGMSRHASEASSATPIGSFTLTRAFGHDADPGTRLPYAQTTPDDWWISEPGPLYNTRQRCATSCAFAQGDPNEHLFYETPAYDYAVVIDYNTGNAPGGVHQGKGSAFFLHVSEGRATAGCVSIPAARLLHILRWLKPRDSPRILIGTG